MTPIHETGRFPRLYGALIVIASLILAIPILYLLFRLWKIFYPYPNLIERCLMIGLLATAGLLIVAYAVGIAIVFAANHFTGRIIIEDTPLRSSTVYASAYSVTPVYTIPFAYNGRDREGDPFCNLCLSFSYAEIHDIYRYLRRKHRVFCYLNTLSLPSHLGKRTPIITRSTAERLLRAMSAMSQDTPITNQRAILCYPFYPTYSRHITLPARQIFLSKSVIAELLPTLTDVTGQILPNTSITVGIGANESICLTAHYLKECLTRIAADDELIYIPIS